MLLKMLTATVQINIGSYNNYYYNVYVAISSGTTICALSEKERERGLQ